MEDDAVEDILLKPASNYIVDEDRDPNYYKMIHHIDDLPTLIDNFLLEAFESDALSKGFL